MRLGISRADALSCKTLERADVSVETCALLFVVVVNSSASAAACVWDHVRIAAAIACFRLWIAEVVT